MIRESINPSPPKAEVRGSNPLGCAKKTNKNSYLEFFSKTFDTKTLYTHYTHRGYNTHK